MNKKKINWKLFSMVLGGLVIIFGLTAWGGLRYYDDLLNPVDDQNKKPVTIEIPSGASLKTIGHILEDEGLIKSAWAFEFYAKWHDLNRYQAGTYTFNPSMSVKELMESLEKGAHKKVILVIDVRQGMWVKEIAEQMAEISGLKNEDILQKLSDPSYIRAHYMKDHPFLTEDIFAKDVKYPLEGYLAPGIYRFEKGKITLDKMVDEMLAQTGKTVSYYHKDIVSNSLGSLHQILTMASLIEQEAPDSENRKRIAGVFYNRLKENMKLQTDPSVAYGQQRRIKQYTAKDLQKDTPYNTYTRKGLIAGPIGSPAVDAIEAVLHPLRSDDLYFYSRPSGEIYYSKTYRQHQQVVNKYRHEWADES